MSCCCKPGKSAKVSTMCLGRCDLPKHRCLDKESVKPGPVPKSMGWLYNSKDSPEFQQRCGWRPGHISCPVLRRIEQHNNGPRSGECPRVCGPPSCPRVCPPPSCCPRHSRTGSSGGPSSSRSGQSQQGKDGQDMGPTCCKPVSFPGQVLIRIIRHAGTYTITTKPSNLNNSPWGPNPLKYVLNIDPNEPQGKAKYSVEAKYNDYFFDYTSSEHSFVIDFSPPDDPGYSLGRKKSECSIVACGLDG